MPTMYTIVNYVFHPKSEKPFFQHIQKHSTHSHLYLHRYVRTAMPTMYTIVNYVFQPNSERHFFQHIQKHSKGIEGIAILM